MLGVDPDRARDAAQEAGDGAADPEPDEFELPPELWPAWECFLATWNQWRVIVGFVAMYYDGIDRTSLASTMGMLGVRKNKRRDVFLQVQILEAEAKTLRNQRD